VLFTYLHLAPVRDLTDKLLESGSSAIAYETVRDRQGTLPLLTPMSEVGGRMSVQVGATYLEKRNAADGGILLGRRAGVRRPTSASSAEGSWGQCGSDRARLWRQGDPCRREPEPPPASWTTSSAAASTPWPRTATTCPGHQGGRSGIGAVLISRRHGSQDRDPAPWVAQMRRAR